MLLSDLAVDYSRAFSCLFFLLRFFLGYYHVFACITLLHLSQAFAKRGTHLHHVLFTYNLQISLRLKFVR